MTTSAGTAYRRTAGVAGEPTVGRATALVAVVMCLAAVSETSYGASNGGLGGAAVTEERVSSADSLRAAVGGGHHRGALGEVREVATRYRDVPWPEAAPADPGNCRGFISSSVGRRARSLRTVPFGVWACSIAPARPHAGRT